MESNELPVFALIRANNQDWPIKFLEDGSTRFVPEGSALHAEFESFRDSNSLTYFDPQSNTLSVKPI